jgi:23S rRNA pseudouridine2604 synthase
MNENSISLNKYLSDTGICSRRVADQWILDGRVTLNGVLARPGNRVNNGDEVLLDGKKIELTTEEALVYIVLHKPPGITCTTETHIKGNIIDFVGHSKRIFPVGRLDKPSEGLILLTNDGDIVNKILRAGNDHEKEYIVSVNKTIDKRFLIQMSRGVPILDTVTKPCIVEQLGKHTFKIILTQGLNRQIRRMCDYLGYEVTRLQRTRIMHIKLDDLPPGKWRDLSTYELNTLHQTLEKSKKHWE